MGTFRNRPKSTENYHNPTHQQYVTGDGWKSGDSDTDAPGAKAAKAAGKEGVAGLKAETARPQAVSGMTGNQSMPEQKTKLGVSTVCIKPNGGAMGQIKGGDPHNYLGHFRSPKVLKEGHNQGAPMTSGGGDMPPPPPPIADAGGTMRPGGGSILATPVTTRPPAMGGGSGMSGAGTAPASGGTTRGGVGTQAIKPMPGAGAMSAPRTKNKAAPSPKAGLRKSIGDVKMARTKLANAIKGKVPKRGERIM